MLSGISALKPSSAHAKIRASIDYSSVIERVKRTLPVAMAQKDITGASIALIDGESIVWSEGFGYTNRSREVRVTADTLFHAGSISKSFTTLGILKAIDQKLLTLDDPVKKHISWFGVNSRFGGNEGEKITIRHLLSHHSGLGTWSPLGNPSDVQYHTRTFEEVVRSTRDSWLKFPPGQRFEYCNQGFDLAGFALQTISNKSFADFMREEILIPLGMTASTFDQAEATRKESCATGYLGKREVPVRKGIVMPLVGAGGLFASANDLARFIIFHLQEGRARGRQILSRALLQEIYTPQVSAENQISGYGLGVYKAIQNDTVRISHGGLGYGISTHYRFLPEHGIGVVLLTNQDTAHSAPELAGGVIDLMLAAKLGRLPKNKVTNSAAKPNASSDGSEVRRLEGTYLLYGGILFRFRFEKGNLFHITGGEKLKLDARSSSEFTHGSRHYKFILGENGKPNGLQITDPEYDPQTAENSVVYLPINDSPADPRGSGKKEWSPLTGRYTGTFLGDPSEVRIDFENGDLYLNGELKLTEIKPDFFLTADGEAVIFKLSQLSIGNKIYSRKQ